MIRLSKRNWWKELEDMEDLPRGIVILLRGIISSYQNHTIPPSAKIQEIRLAKAYLYEGIEIDNEFFEIMVYSPNNLETHHQFFCLVRKLDMNGQFMKLNEMNRETSISGTALLKVMPGLSIFVAINEALELLSNNPKLDKVIFSHNNIRLTANQETTRLELIQSWAARMGADLNDKRIQEAHFKKRYPYFDSVYEFYNFTF